MARNVIVQSKKRLKSQYYEKDEDGNPTDIPIKGKKLSNLELMLKYIGRRENEDLSHCTITADIHALTEFSRVINKPVKDLTETDIYNFFEYLKQKSKNSAKIHKVMVRGFLNFAGREDLGNLCKTRKSHTEKKLPDDLLTHEEIEQLIDWSTTIRDKALIATLYETGAREGELEELQIKHVKFDEYGAIITLPKGKTGARTNRVVYAAGYLRNWIDSHSQKYDRDAWLWASQFDSSTHISYNTLWIMLRRTAERAGIKRE